MTNMSANDMALMAMKRLKKMEFLNMEESDEINACSIVVPVEIDKKGRRMADQFPEWTHNHPTEIEPFGDGQYVLEERSVTIIRTFLCISGNACYRCC